MANQYQYSAEEPLAQPARVSVCRASAPHAERYYAVAEIAEMWNLSADKIRELFENERDVLVIGERSPRHKRRYVTLRIPQTVLERVHLRLSAKSAVR